MANLLLVAITFCEFQKMGTDIKEFKISGNNIVPVLFKIYIDRVYMCIHSSIVRR